MRAGRIAAVVACALGLVLGLGALHRLTSGSSAAGGSARSARRAASGHRSAPPLTGAERRLQRALSAGVSEAARSGGQIEAAAMLDGSAAPLVATSERAAADRYMRMWSMSKVATMVALFKALGWGERSGETPSHEVLEALAGALTRSENCRQRRVVLELQRAARGTGEARRALAAEFAEIGGRIEPGSQVAPPESLCVPFLRTQTEIPEPLAPALLLGTSRWRVTDAVRLAHALAVASYGRALSAAVRELMAAPKRPSRESRPGELTAPVDWGAGVVFGDLDPAYKAGWGGSLHGNFLAGQIAIVPLPGGGHLSLAVMFHPDEQPVRDDPGITAAPGAIETVMRAVRAASVPAGEVRPNANGQGSGTD